MATSALTLLKQDHREVEDLFARYRNTTDPEQRRLVVEQIIRELSIHAAVEEQFLYPAVQAELSDGERLAREARQEHQEVKELLAELDRTAATEPGYDARVRSLIEDVSHHVREEETEMFPKFENALGRDRLLSMGRAMEVAKMVAPTHPHPNAPDEPPGVVVAGLAASVVDRSRDAARDVVRRVTGSPRKPTVRKRATAKKATAPRKASSAKGTAKRATKRAASSAKRATSSAKRTAKSTARRASSTAKRAGSSAKRTTKSTAKRATSTAKRATSSAKRTAKSTAKRATSTSKRTAKSAAKKAPAKRTAKSTAKRGGAKRSGSRRPAA